MAHRDDDFRVAIAIEIRDHRRAIDGSL